MASDINEAKPGASPSEMRRRRKIALRLGIAWIVFVLLLLLWQTVSYTGIAAAGSEWQFDHLGRSFPAFEMILFAFLLAVPALLLWRWAAQSRQRRARGAPIDALERYGQRFVVIMGVLAGVFLLAAVIALLPALSKGPGSGTPRQIALGTPASVVPEEGPATLVGRLRLDRVALYDQKLLLTHRVIRYAPMQPPGVRGAELRYFVELDPKDGMQPVDGARTGMLKRQRLPGAVAQLYRNAGYAVANPNYVLYVTGAAQRRPFFVTSAQFATVALILALAALFQRWRLRRLRRLVDAGPQQS